MSQVISVTDVSGKYFYMQHFLKARFEQFCGDFAGVDFCTFVFAINLLYVRVSLLNR